ncbi:MFS transporter [Populibacterium corticicola]|uniref:MFS transporter n=1 Tax=Populibacterium corticicola TaxID=1812826 RepID=A0ABW5XBL1_9MICO
MSNTPAQAPEGRPLREVLPALVALGVSIFIAITTELMPVGLLLLLAEDFGKSVAEVGIIVTVYATMVAVLSVPLTILTKRFERKTVLLATLAAFTLSSIVVSVSPYFWLVAVGRALGGAAHALFFAVAIGYPARLLRPADLGKGMAIVTSGVSLGFVLGVPAATALGVAFSWRVSFGIVAAVAVVLTLAVWRWLPSVPNVMSFGSAQTKVGTQETTSSGRAEKWNRSVPFISVLVVNLAVFLAHYSAYTYINPLLEHAAVAKEYVSLVLLIFGGAGLIGLAVVGRFLDVRPRAALLVTLVVFIVGLVGFALAINNLWLALFFALLWTAAFGGAPPFFSTGGVRTAVVSPDMTGAWVNATSNIGISVGAIIGGWVLAGAGLEFVPLLAAALFAVTAVIVWFSRRGFPSSPIATRVADIL